MGERDVFHSLLREKKSGVIWCTKKKDLVSTKYVADCSSIILMVYSRRCRNFWMHYLSLALLQEVRQLLTLTS